ncbi:MAG TPA: hypothetical protein VMB82_05940, partial [Acidimicrobiales bacterium]|nr:hypothetical protein [Acidimicrobiales bacterium]
STGAANDLVGNTELARKMVREWGMSEQIGPMAWGSQGQVFLGEDLLHSRDYSESTSRVIDDEVERILRDQEQRAIEMLTRHRAGLEAVARDLLQQETVDGGVVGRLVDEAYGRPVHGSGAKAVPHFHSNGKTQSGTNGAGPAAVGRPAASTDPIDAGDGSRDPAAPAPAGLASADRPSEASPSPEGRDGAGFDGATVGGQAPSTGPAPSSLAAQPWPPPNPQAPSAPAPPPPPGSPPPPPPTQAGWAPPRWTGSPTDGGSGVDQYANPQHPGRQNANDQYANPQHPPGPAETGPAQPDPS